MEDVPIAVREKRKRGRPRKDSNLCSASTLSSPEYSTLMRNHAANQSIYPTPPAPAPPPADPDKNPTIAADDAMVGSSVYGVVEGSFDAGYLISIRIGNNLTFFRGLVFQPRNVIALTPSNDVAPHAKMHQRREIEIPIPIPNPLPPQAPTNPDEGKTAYNVAGDLRMVEEGEVMQAFEVSTSPGGGSKSNLPNNGDSVANHEAPPPPPNLQMCHGGGGDMELPQVRPTNLFQDVNFQENMFSNHQESPNLKLDLEFAAQKEKQMEDVYKSVLSGMKNPSIGFHQALVAGNPLLLPPDLIGEPLEFMMEKPKSPPSPQTEAQSRMVGSGERFGGGEAMNRAASPAGVNARIGDMDFMIMQQTHTNN
ncbi:hypothetical protein SASPL_146544 [Salvia splendens]|uniref:Uncharacterized protein n=1 Tax=Salvia splendens TaxID=180675 RepID=A0A8X8Z5T9_SALSN|nr:hypothetical protein SASPL_146544 [Salvia splendens]